MQKILVIQTAFTGDVILATAMVEYLAEKHPDAAIDFLLKKGNESLLDNHPYIRNVLVLDKSRGKFRSLKHLLKTIRSEQYDLVVNAHRFGSSGILTAFSGAGKTVGFKKNPFSFLFDKSVSHEISAGSRNVHEVDRNMRLLTDLPEKRIRPKLYPSASDFANVKRERPYITMAPASVWFTKQYPEEKWVALIEAVVKEFPYDIVLIGGPGDHELCERIRTKSGSDKVDNKAGELSFLQSAALIKNAVMNYVNDSAPLHMASATNAPVAAIYCSTVPAFGFFPLSDKSFILETDRPLACRPCGLHGKKSCPEGHFACADIDTEKLVGVLRD